MQRRTSLFACCFALAALDAGSAPVLMSAEWGKAACAQWNSDPVLPVKLHESGWIANHKGRAGKRMRIARSDCPSSALAELRIEPRDGRAQCVQGGEAQAAPLDYDVDYLMTAETRRWQEMGRGDYGPMRAMMFGRLSFEGPMGEAMGNMGPFESFLLLVGKVPGEADSCPK